MQVRFWGVRGSIPCPGPNTVKYGGNTACLELRIKENNRLIIVDAGSGIRDIGGYMMANDLPRGPMKTEIFLTHTHWDHIMGFPFFTPIYIPGTQIKVYGPISFEEDSLEQIVGGQLTYRYFPVRQAELASKIEYIDLKEDEYDLGDGIRLKTKYLNHPVLCLGYRFEYQGKVFCTAYDTEPFRNLFAADPNDPSFDEMMANEGQQAADEENRRVEEFFAGADLLVHDAQYTEKEYQSARIGWGHTSFEHTLAAARRAKVKRLALFHHDPERTDAHMDEMAQSYCQADPAEDIDIFFAREGMSIDL